LRTETQQPLIVVDAGNLLFKNPLSGAEGSNDTTSLIIAHGITRAYQAMNYDAVAVSSTDLSAGRAFFRQTSGNPFPWISANIYEPGGDLFFQPHIIKKSDNVTVGIIGLTGNNWNGSRDFIVGDWRKALEVELTLLEKSCDILVVLSNLTSPENMKIQRDFSQVDIIVTADAKGANIKPQMSPNSLVVQSGGRGKYLGKLDITGHAEGNWHISSPQLPQLLTQKKDRLTSIDRQLSQLEKQQNEVSGESGESGESENFSNKIARLKSYQKIISDQIAQQTMEIAQSETQPIKSFTSVFLPILPGSSKDNIGAIVQEINESINTFNRYRRANLHEDDPALRLALQKDEIIGISGCVYCHEKQTAFWKNTRHASAYTTLSRQGQSFNLRCLPCHVTGGNISASSAESELLFLLSLNTDRQAIGCEVCHGPGNRHLLSQGEEKPIRIPPKEICTKCHTPERDNNFDFTKKRAVIACPTD
jgi:hypothetical protein